MSFHAPIRTPFLLWDLRSSNWCLRKTLPWTTVMDEVEIHTCWIGLGCSNDKRPAMFFFFRTRHPWIQLDPLRSPLHFPSDVGLKLLRDAMTGRKGTIGTIKTGTSVFLFCALQEPHVISLLFLDIYIYMSLPIPHTQLLAGDQQANHILLPPSNEAPECNGSNSDWSFRSTTANPGLTNPRWLSGAPSKMVMICCPKFPALKLSSLGVNKNPGLT